MKPTCEQVRALAPELALGIADAGERAAVVDHLDQCPGCREELAGLSDVVDELLLLGPEAEPPLGFESRVMARVAVEAADGRAPVVPLTTTRRRSRIRTAVIAVAAAVVAAVGTAAVVRHDEPNPPAISASDRFAVLHGKDGSDVGRVILHDGPEPWVFMAVRQLDGEAYKCELVLADGTKVTIGTLRATNGRGSWGGAANMDLKHVKWVHVVDADGTVFANATV
jgi:hypothetical protein